MPMAIDESRDDQEPLSPNDLCLRISPGKVVIGPHGGDLFSGDGDSPIDNGRLIVRRHQLFLPAPKA